MKSLVKQYAKIQKERREERTHEQLWDKFYDLEDSHRRVLARLDELSAKLEEQGAKE